MDKIDILRLMIYIGAIIGFVLSNIILILFVLSLVFALGSLLKQRGKLNRLTVLDTILKWYILFNIGIHHLYSAFVLIFFGKLAAAYVGWPFSPFTNEVGFANLSFSIVGFIAFKASRPFQNAIMIVVNIFLLGAFCGHLYQIITANNLSHGNAVQYLLCGILLPIVSFMLIYLRAKEGKRKVL